MTDKKRVALIYGGRGLEHSVSVSGAKDVLLLIDRERYEIYPIFIERDGSMHLCLSDGTCNTRVVPAFLDGRGVFLTDEGKRLPVDAALPLLHGDFGEDGSIQGLLTSCSIPFVGSDARASAICIDKAVTKAVAESLGIPTVPWRLITDGKSGDLPGYPLFVKPDGLGSSIGARPARSPEELDTAIAEATRLGGTRVLVEKLIYPIRELECAYFSAQGERTVTAPGEILCDGFYSYEKKYSAHSAKTAVSADLPKQISERIREYSDRLCRFIGVRHLARVDFFLSGDELYFNEINTMPGMTASSLYLRLLDSAGISPQEAVNRMISDAITEVTP